MKPSTPGEMQVIFPSQTQYIHLITIVATNAATMAGLSEKAAGKIAVATDEAVTNVIKHAYGGRSDKIIKFRINFTEDSLILEVRHTGKPLTKDDVKLPNMKEYIQERRRGGLGLFLITKFMDEVDYLVGEENCYKMIKYIKPGKKSES